MSHEHGISFLAFIRSVQGTGWPPVSDRPSSQGAVLPTLVSSNGANWKWPTAEPTYRTSWTYIPSISRRNVAVYCPRT